MTTEPQKIDDEDDACVTIETTAEMRQVLMEVGINTIIRNYLNSPLIQPLATPHKVILFYFSDRTFVMDISTPQLKEQIYKAMLEYIEICGPQDILVQNSITYQSAKDGNIECLFYIVDCWMGQEGLDWEITNIVTPEQFLKRTEKYKVNDKN